MHVGDVVAITPAVALCRCLIPLRRNKESLAMNEAQNPRHRLRHVQIWEECFGLLAGWLARCLAVLHICMRACLLVCSLVSLLVCLLVCVHVVKPLLGVVRKNEKDSRHRGDDVFEQIHHYLFQYIFRAFRNIFL